MPAKAARCVARSLAALRAVSEGNRAQLLLQGSVCVQASAIAQRIAGRFSVVGLQGRALSHSRHLRTVGRTNKQAAFWRCGDQSPPCLCGTRKCKQVLGALPSRRFAPFPKIHRDGTGVASSAKFLSIASPRDWLFSGWNWVANRLSRQIIEQKGSGYSVSVAMTVGSWGTT